MDLHRNALLRAARGVLDGTLPHDVFFALVKGDDYADRRLAKLIDWIEHPPSKSHLFGVGIKEYEKEMAQIRRLIEEAAKD